MNASKPLHPTFEELVALTVGELPEPRAEEVRDHLLDCPECLAEARELLKFSDTPPSPEKAIGEAEVDAAWRRLDSAIPKPVTKPFELLPGGGEKAVPPPARPARERRWALPLAALLAAAIGMAFDRWVLVPKPEIRPVTFTTVRSSIYYTRGAPVPAVKSSCPPPGADFLWVVLPHLPPTGTPKDLHVEILDKSREIIGTGLFPLNENDELVILLPRSLISDGEYRIRLRGTNAEMSSEELTVTVNCR